MTAKRRGDPISGVPLSEILAQARTESWPDLALVEEKDRYWNPDFQHVFELKEWDPKPFETVQGLEAIRSLAIMGLAIGDPGAGLIASRLPQLAVLNLRACRVGNEGARAIMNKLTGLTSLYLYDNQLTNVPAEIGKLTGLTRLDLGANQLTSVPAEIGKLTGLTTLVLQGNQLTSVPAEIVKLTGLTELNLRGNQLTSVQAEIGKLTGLTELNLGSNQLTSVPTEIVKLTGLTELNLGVNQLTSVPAEIGKLTGLTRLDLQYNQLTSVPAEIGKLTVLERLSLRENQLESLPQELWQLKSLKPLDLDGNPLVSPPLEIVEQGRAAVTAYFQQAGPTRALAEVKVVLVGHGEAGKTSLVRQLIGEAFNPAEDRTHGINIRDHTVRLNASQVRCRLWDFGGQEIMHATHRFFLSRRSLFIVVLDGRRDEDPEYWLSHARTYSDDAPVLVVLNKVDQNPGYQLEFKKLREKYPQIRGFHYTSCQKGTGIEELKTALAEELAKVPLIQTQWPEKWLQVKAAMEADAKPFLSRSQFSDLCTEHGIRHAAQEGVLARFLNDLGIAITFDGLYLDETHILDPEWATNGVYRILNHPSAAAAGGLVATDRESLTALLAAPAHADQCAKAFDYPREKHPFLVELMSKFEVCFRLDEADRILIPDLLPKSEPDFQFDYATATKFRCGYIDFLPPTLMPRFMVRRHRDIDGLLRWRTGMVIRAKTSDARALVTVDRQRRELLIWITGSQRREYLASLRETLALIHEDFPKVRTQQQIGCPCTACRGRKSPYFFDYEKVLGFYLKGSMDFPCQDSLEMIPIPQILEGVFAGQTKLLEEIRDTVRELLHKTDFQGTGWDKFKETVSAKVGIGIKVDLLNILEKIFTRERPRP